MVRIVEATRPPVKSAAGQTIQKRTPETQFGHLADKDPGEFPTRGLEDSGSAVRAGGTMRTTGAPAAAGAPRAIRAA